MKRTFLLPCFLLGSLSVMAQSNHFNPFHPSPKNKHQKLVAALLAHQPGSTAHKGTTSQQRVIAQASLDEGLSVQDTLTYKYSGTRGSNYNYNNMDLNYNEAYTSDYLPMTIPWATQPSSKDLLADSITYYYAHVAEDNSFAYYRPDNTTDSFIDVYHDNGTDYTTKTFHAFNNKSYLTQVVTMDNYNNGGTTYDTSMMIKYFYNATNTQLTTDTVYQPEVNGLAIYYTDKYHYNDAGLVDSISSYDNNGSTYDLTSIVAVQYTPTKNIQKITDVSFDNGAPVTINVDSFGYTGTLNPFYTYYQNTYTDLSGSGSMDSFRVVKHLGSNTLPDTMLFQAVSNGAWLTETKAVYYYNSYDNPDSLIGYAADGTFAGRFNFYYELYDDGVTAINNIKQNKDFNLYPNPFSNKINIEWKGATSGDTKIALVNVLGQTVYSINQTLATGSNTINIPAMNSGNYILLIQDAKGNTWKSKMVKQ